MKWRQPSAAAALAAALAAASLLQVVAAQTWSRPPNQPVSQCPAGQACVPLRSCPTLFTMVQRDRAEPEVVALLQQAHCGYVPAGGPSAPAHPKVCCAASPPAQSAPPRGAPPRPAAAGNGSLPAAGLRLLPMDECGPVLSDRIIGGSEAAVMELPWMARLGYRNEFSPELDYNCGGSLISSRYVLTAAHCINENTGLVPVSVRLGELDTSQLTDCSFTSGERLCAPPVVDVTIERIVKHKNYGENRLQNDIALLRLVEPVAFTDFVRPVCLPVDKDESARELTGKKVTVAGWGRVANRNGAGGSKKLMKVKVTVSEHRDCASAYLPLQHPIAAEKQLCAAEKGKDSCNGDSGGPLTAPGRLGGAPRVLQFGVVSFGPSQCASEGVPGVYTRVSYYLPWILSIMEP